MQKSPEGYVPEPKFLYRFMRNNRLLCDLDYTNQHAIEGFLVSPVTAFDKRIFYRVSEFETPIDSSNAQPDNWV